MKKVRFLATLLLIVLLISALSACAKIPNDKDDNQQDKDDPLSTFELLFDYEGKAQQYFDDLGTVERNIPTETKDGGLERYPVYGTNLPQKPDQTKQQWVAEAKEIWTENMFYISTKNQDLTGACNNYDSMDENGYFYLNGEHVLDYKGNNLQLFKHTTADGMYFGGLSDDEQAIKRQITITPRVANYDDYITGLYAPAGEIIKIEVTQADLDACGGSFYIYIGQHLLSGKANNIWIPNENKVANNDNITRMPIIATKFQITKPVTYVGSFFGGPIYIGKPNSTNTFSTTISGGVPYSNYILGYTTEEEFNKYKNSTAPYFDLEVWDDGVRFSGPRKYADPFSYDDLTKAAVLWDKISRVSNVIGCGSDQRVGIEFMFDPFIAAGSAVAFTGNNSVNCPLGWMSDVLDYNRLVKQGSWGNIHEYNHHYQSFGLPDRSEVSNNATSLVEYALFTNISASRTLTKDYTVGEAWNRFTVASGALKETLKAQESGLANHTLSSYADLLHAFGPAHMLEVMRQESNSAGTENWFKALSRTMKYDFTYYFEEILNVEVPDSAKEEIKGKNYPVFVPVATTLQVGRLFEVDGVTYNSNTMRPFVVDPSKPFEFDLQSLIVVPSNFRVTIKNVSSPANGTLTDNNGTYSYTFADEADTSGIFYVTLGLQDRQNQVTVNDVVLALNFQKEGSAETFNADYFYGRSYVTSIAPSVIASKYNAHDNSWTLANLFDNNVNTFIHTKDGVAITESNTFEITVDLQQTVAVDSLTMIGRRGGSQYVRTPIDFKLYGGTTKGNLTLIGEWSNLQLVDIDEENNLKDAYVTFDRVDIRYYKLVVTKAIKGGAVCFSDLIIGGDILTLHNAKIMAPNHEGVTFKGDWVKNAKGTFGYHIAATNAKATLEVEFTGKQFALYSFYDGKPMTFEISIDGGEFKKITVVNESGRTMLTYLSKELQQGKHKVIIKGSTNFNFDYFAVG